MRNQKDYYVRKKLEKLFKLYSFYLILKFKK